MHLEFGGSLVYALIRLANLEANTATMWGEMTGRVKRVVVEVLNESKVVDLTLKGPCDVGHDYRNRGKRRRGEGRGKASEESMRVDTKEEEGLYILTLIMDELISHIQAGVIQKMEL